MEGDDKKKAHRDRHSGKKAEKKKQKKDATNPTDNLTDRQRNPKAFAINSAIGAERRFRRKQDIDTKKQHVPLVDRTPIEPPPILIAVVGPPKVGKTTVINNLIRLFTRSPMSEVKGPVTVVIGKKRRITLIECNNDVNSMIDLAKVADLVLLLCDASFGFEMEVFEFLNICQVHGMPRIMGVLTHLDMIKNTKTLKATKKTLKHRFWTEVYQGAKLFYLSGIVHGEYLRNEIKNLGRFISVMKFRPLLWRTTHSHVLVDRYEDLTEQELLRKHPKAPRNLALYGYIRGIPLRKDASVHIAGMGDMRISDASHLHDPCPLPDELKKRALVEKEKLVYAPFSGVGGIVYDKDAVYVELGGSHSHAGKAEGESADIFSNLIEVKEALDVKMQHSQLQLFSGGEALISKDWKEQKNYEEVEDSGRIRRKVVFDEEDEEMAQQIEEEEDNNSDSDEAEDVDNQPTPNGVEKKNQVHSKVTEVLQKLSEKQLHFESLKAEDAARDSSSSSDEEEEIEENSSSDDDEDDGDLKWKHNLHEKAAENFLNRLQNRKNLMKTVYGYLDNTSSKQNDQEQLQKDGDDDEAIGGLFKKVARDQRLHKQEAAGMDLTESPLYLPWNENITNWLESKDKIRNCFVTGEWKEHRDAAALLKMDDAHNLSDADSEEELFGDFEDLETGEKHSSKAAPSKEKDEEADREALNAKKAKLKEKFNAEYDNTDKSSSHYDALKAQAEAQAQLNRTVFDSMADEVRVQLEGFRPGMYVRMEFRDVSSEFVLNFDPTYPLIVGALNLGEENVGYVNVKIKKHRWYKKILKTGDPLILSLGWRRFQTVPLYSKLEDDLKFRYLKYTPEHLACNAHFWGPVTPQGTGFLALQSVRNGEKGFRIAATGSVQELDKSTQIMKKLKLVGYPLKIYKKTAFVKGMFNSSLEVAKFEGARVKTVSGIRGQIKKSVNKPEGAFRATFEDKIQLSDIVFCRTWFKVDVPKLYNPVTSLLLEEKHAWKGARTTAEIKRERNIKADVPNEDHLYREVERVEVPLKPLVIPSKLQKALPYRDKPKNGVKEVERKQGIKRVAVVQEPREQKVAKMMKMIKAAYEHKQDKLKEETKERLERHRAQMEGVEHHKLQKLKQKKKEVFRKKSKAQSREDAKAAKGGKKHAKL